MPPKTSKNLKAAAPSKKAAAPTLKNSAPRNAGKAAKAKKKKHAPNRKHVARPGGGGGLSNKGVLRELVRDGREEDIVADKWTTSLINPFMYAPPYLGTAGVSTSYMQTYGRKIYTASDFTAGADTLMILIPPQNTGFWSRITTSTGSGAFSATTLTNSSNVAASYTGRCTAWGLKWSMDIPDSEVTPFVFAGVMPLRENITTALTAASPAFVNGSMNYPILTGARALTGYIGGRPLSGTAGTGGQLDMSQQWIATSPTVYPIAAYPYFCIQGVSSSSQIKLCLEFVQHWETLNTPFNGGAGAAYSTNAVKFHDIDSILERMYDRHGRALQNPVKLHPTVFTTCNTTGTMTTTNFVDGATSDGSGSLSRSNFDPVAQKYKESEYNSLITHAVGAAGLGATYLMNRLYRVAGVPGPRHPPGGYRVQAQAFWVHAPNPNPGPAPSLYRAVTLAEIDPSNLQAFDPSVQAASQRFFNYVRSGWLERYGIGSERKWYAKFDQNGEYITLANSATASAFETQASVHSAGWRNIGHLADEISRRDAGAIASAHGWGDNTQRLMWNLLDDAAKQAVLDQVNSALVPAGSSGNHLGGFSIIGDGGRVSPLPIMVSNMYAQFLVAQAAEEQRKKQMENVINNVTRIRIEDVTDAPESTRHSSFSDIGEEEKAVDLTQSTVLKAVQSYLRK